MFGPLMPVFKLLVKLFMAASIEAPLAFFKKPKEVFFFYAIKSSEMSLCLVPKILNAVDMIFLVCKQLGVIDAHVVKVRHIEGVIGTKSICVNNTIRLYFFLNNRQKSVAFCIGNNY